MHIDQTNIINLSSELSKLSHDLTDTTVSIGQLRLEQLQTLFTALHGITHIRKLIFAADCINNENIETIEHFIKNHKINYEILYQSNFQRIFLSVFMQVMQLGMPIEETPIGFRITYLSDTPPMSPDKQEKIATVPNQQNGLQETSSAEKDALTPLIRHAAQPSPPSILKRAQNNEQTLSLPTTPQKRVRFMGQNETPSNEEIIHSHYNKLAHIQCGSVCELHKAICLGQEAETTQLIEAMSPEHKQKLLTAFCSEEEFLGASILRLALRTDQIQLLDILLTSGVNPLLCSHDGNTLLHDIVLELKSFAITILLKHLATDNKIQQLINLPFCGETYNGYYALDIICVEASLQFEGFHQTKLLSKKEIAHTIFSIINNLLKNHAQSKLLLDQSKNLHEFIKPDHKDNYSPKVLWKLIALIAENHELQSQPDNIQTPQNNIIFTVKMLAEQWQRNGILPRPKSASSKISQSPSSTLIDNHPYKTI